MNIDAAQYRRIVTAASEISRSAAPPENAEAKGDPYRAKGDGVGTVLPASDAELVIAIAQLAVAADRRDDPDERALFTTLAAHVYAHAKLATSPPTLEPIADEEQRSEHMQSHAAQLAGKPTAGLAFAVAYILAIADLDLAQEEGELLDELRDALGLSADQGYDLATAVAEIITPAEE